MSDQKFHTDDGEARPKEDVGAAVQRFMIIVGLPLLSLLAGYAAKVTLDNISLHIAEVAASVDVLKVDVGEIKATVNPMRDGFTRLNEHAIGADRRLDNLENHKR